MKKKYLENSTQSKINHTANHWLTNPTYKIENQLRVQCFRKLNRNQPTFWCCIWPMCADSHTYII